MATPHHHTFRGKNFLDLIIYYHNIKPKLKSRTSFVKKNVLLFPNRYLYHDEVSRDDLIYEITETFGPYTYGRIFQVHNTKKDMIQYMFKYDTKKAVVNGLGFCGLCA